MKAERANYLDAGVTQKIGPGPSAGAGRLLQDVQRTSLMTACSGRRSSSPRSTTREGEVYGLEFTGSYSARRIHDLPQPGPLGGEGRGLELGGVSLRPGRLGLRQEPLDLPRPRSAAVRARSAASYVWKERTGDTRVYVDSLYGTGLRTDATAPDGTNIPNGGTVPAYYSISLGAEQSFKVGLHRLWKLRLDVINITDKSYELRRRVGRGRQRGSIRHAAGDLRQHLVFVLARRASPQRQLTAKSTSGLKSPASATLMASR